MALKDLFATKSLEQLHEEMKGENRLRRVLGPVGLTSLGVGAIIGAGIFVITGRVAANDAGPGVLISYAVAGLACALAAFCYAEFASMAPVAGSAYTYAYATLGEILAWIIGWDLILEYAMSAAVVAASWTKYFNKLLHVLGLWEVPERLSNDPFSTPGAWLNLPAVLILLLVTTILVIGIRESAASNTALVILKVSVVVFVIVFGVGYASTTNWFDIPFEARKTPEQIALSDAADEFAAKHKTKVDVEKLKKQATALLFTQLAEEHKDLPYLVNRSKQHAQDLPTTETDIAAARAVLEQAREKAPELINSKWGMVAQIGINKQLEAVDNAARSNFMPYGLSGVMVGAALVFFAFIGFDSISTHSEEAIKPQRDVPIGIIASLGLCTLLYVAVAGIITGMVPYPEIDVNAAVASAFTDRAKMEGGSGLLNAAGGLIAAGALAGMTSVLLITFLSQARVFLAMARDGLMPQRVFGAVHEKFKTPHLATMLTGGLMMIVAAFTPIEKLEEMVNIGTLFAFVVVCAAVLILRIKRPEAHRPFRTPLVFVIAPAGILVNLVLMFFLAPDTWLRLVVWLVIGLCIYFTFGIRNSVLRKRNLGQVPQSL
jgi:basic amino acid/polyamine antiporter, APA family